MLKFELLATRETGVNGMTVCLKPRMPVVITPGLVQEIRQLQNSLAEQYLSKKLSDNFYVIWFLENRQGVNYRGLDFDYIVKCLKNNKHTDLENYIEGIYNLIFLNHIGLGFPIINCSIISRVLTGLSQEFFFTNKICFIHNSQSAGIEEISITDENKGLLLNKKIYGNNRYFYFDFLHLGKMRNIIETTASPIDNITDLNALKDEFETIKKQTLTRIYCTAGKGINILERMADTDRIHSK